MLLLLHVQESLIFTHYQPHVLIVAVEATGINPAAFTAGILCCSAQNQTLLLLNLCMTVPAQCNVSSNLSKPGPTIALLLFD